MTTERDTHLRAILAENVGRAPRRVSLRTVVATTLVAFALGGGVVGGAVSATAGAFAPMDQNVPAMIFDQFTDGGYTIGEIHTYVGSESVTLDLGERPSDATGIAVYVQCGGTGSFDQVTGGTSSSGTCDPSTGFGRSTTTPPTDSLVSITPAEPFDYTVWAQWIFVPDSAQPSPEQLDAIADGEVTDAERAVAIERFTTCVDATGFDVAVDTSGDTLSWSSTIEAQNSGAISRCVEAEVEQLEQLWLEPRD